MWVSCELKGANIYQLTLYSRVCLRMTESAAKVGCDAVHILAAGVGSLHAASRHALEVHAMILSCRLLWLECWFVQMSFLRFVYSSIRHAAALPGGLLSCPLCALPEAWLTLHRLK